MANTTSNDRLRVLVTGANGHLGANIVRALNARGHRPIAFVRPTSSLSSLDGLSLPRTLGDIEDRQSLIDAAAGCDAIIHTATRLSLRDKDPQAVLRPALLGTQNVLEAAQAVGVSRVIHTSSVVACGGASSPDQLRTESDWHPNPRNAYWRAKTESERLALELAPKLGVQLVSLCPAWVLGPHDHRITATTRILRQALEGRFMLAVGGWNLVSASDVADAYVAALERGVAGRRYIIAGDNITFKRTGEIVAELTGVSNVYLPTPRWLSLLGVALMEPAQRLLGIDPPATYSEAREVVGRYLWFDNRAAREDLGLQPRPAEEVIREGIRWLAHHGELEPGLAEGLRERYPPDGAWATTGAADLDR